jgi:copper chaperone CopZ
MESLFAIVVLAVILSAAFILQSYLMKFAYGSCAGKNEMKSKRTGVAEKNSGHHSYQAVLTIDGMLCENCAGLVRSALNRIDGVRAETDIFKRQAFVRMEREIGDDALCSAVESLGSYTVTKIERP